MREMVQGTTCECTCEKKSRDTRGIQDMGSHGLVLDSYCNRNLSVQGTSIQAFCQKSGNDRVFFLVGCVKNSRAARF